MKHADKRTEKWIRDAVNPAHRGDLRRYIRAHYGAAGFTSRGTIRLMVLRKLSRGDGHVAHMADFALAVQGLR